MKLPIVKKLEYISPSTLNVLLDCEYSTYLTKMAGKDIPREPTNEQMALGTCFDAHAKNAINLAHHLKLGVTLGSMLKDLPDNMRHMIAYGKAVFDNYEYFGCLDELLKIGIEAIELNLTVPIVAPTISDEDGYRDKEQFIIHGFPDVVLKDNKPHDFKVSGWGSSRVKSPKPGYESYRISLPDSIDFKDKGKHPQCGIPLEQIDEKWARQMLLYCWALSADPETGMGTVEDKEYRASLDQIILQADGRIGVAKYDTYISRDFNNQTFDQCCDIWRRMNNGEIAEPIPNLWKCEPFRKPRACTVACPNYQSTLGDPMMRELYES